MTTAGPNYAADHTTDNGNGSFADWNNTTNAHGTADGAFATVNVGNSAADTFSYYLILKDFGFAIPSGATINGITFELNAKANNTGLFDLEVLSVKGGTVGGTNKASGTQWSTTLGYRTYGASNDLWGRAWTDSDINSSTFGMAVSVQRSGSNRTASIDNGRVTIDYTTSSGVTATASVSFGPLAVTTFDAVVSVKADISASFGALTSSTTANSVEFVATLAASFAPFSANMVGTMSAVGDVAASFGGLSASIAGNSVEDVGAVSASFGPLECTSLTGTGSAKGDIGADFGSLGVSITASFADFLATLSASFGGLSAAIDASASIGATITASFGGLTAELSSLTAGAMPNSFIATNFGHFTAAITGTIDAPVYTGDIAASFGALVWTPVGPTSGTFADFIGSFAVDFGPLTGAIDAFFVPTLDLAGTLDVSFGALTATTFTGSFLEAVEHFPALGGFSITSAVWISQGALRIDYESNYTGVLYQVYAGRTLVGVSDTAASTFVVAAVFASHWPQWITLLAVEPDDRLTDYGPQLPLRAYNRARLLWDTSGWNDDARYSEIAASPAPDDPVDETNVISLEEFDTDGSHTFLTDPLPGSGVWSFEIAGRDKRPPDGNRGDELELSTPLLSTPPDCLLHGDGTRLTASVAAGVLTLGFDYDWRGT